MKIRYIALLMILSFPAYALEYVEVAKKSSCTDVQFTDNLLDHDVYIASYRKFKDGTLSAKIDYPKNKVNAYRWSAKITAYLTLRTPTAAQTNAFLSHISTIKRHIKASLKCAEFSSVNMPNKVYSGNVGAFETTLGYSSLFDAYPKRPGNKEVIILPDTIADIKQVTLSHIPRITVAKSLLDIPAISDLPGTDWRHSNMLMFNGFLLSSANINLLAITKDGIINASHIPMALNYAAQTTQASKKYVLNQSFGCLLGDSVETKKEISGLIKKGIPVIQAIGNGGKVWDDMEYNANTITVGYSVGGNLKSSYGNTGPDLVVPMDGNAPLAYRNGAVYGGSLAQGQSSLAAMQMSSIVSRMQSYCPEATPKNIKNVLCLTAEAMRPSPNIAINAMHRFIKCGVVKPLQAIQLLMDTTCAHRTPVVKVAEPVYSEPPLKSERFDYFLPKEPNKSMVSAFKSNCDIVYGGVIRLNDAPNSFPRYSCYKPGTALVIPVRVYYHSIPGTTARYYYAKQN